MVKRLPQLSLAQVYPRALVPINLNTCGDPDCGNFGVAPSNVHAGFRGPNAGRKRFEAGVSNAGVTAGLGRYKMSGPSHLDLERVWDVPEYSDDPHMWSDGRVELCPEMGDGV